MALNDATSFLSQLNCTNKEHYAKEMKASRNIKQFEVLIRLETCINRTINITNLYHFAGI